MKLFGNKRHTARTAGSHAAHAAASHSRKGRLSGAQKGLLMLLASTLLLTLTVFAVYKDFVKPMERPQPDIEDSQTETELPEEQVFTPPTDVEVVTDVDPETGEEQEMEVEVPASHKEGFYNILVVGTDDDGLRTDTILIARIDVNDHSVALLSVPRDTLIGATGNKKINSVYGLNGKNTKGMEALKRTLASILGFEVDGYVLVDLDAFVELVDLVDGVDFFVPQRMYYIDPTQDLYIDLHAGMQHLDGAKAMQLVRFRGYAAADIQRTKVQQDFLRALAKKCLSVTNLTKIGGLADIFSDNVLTDLSVGNIAYFGQELLKCDFDKMYTHTLEGEGLSIDGISVWALYLNKTLSVINEYFNPYQVQITAANVSFRTPDHVKAGYAPPASTLPQEPEETQEPSIEDETGLIPVLPDDETTEPDDTELPPEDVEQEPEDTQQPDEPGSTIVMPE